MSAETFVSYAQNAEDVVLWRALRHVENGSYVDVGAWHASIDSVTKAFYDRGWRGVDVEPVPEMAAELRAERPGDDVVEAIVTSADEPQLTLHTVNFADGELTGLSTAAGDIADDHARSGWAVEDIAVPTRSLTSIFASDVLGPDVHFLKVDVEGMEADVLLSLDLKRIRPWILVVEATLPDSTEPSHAEWEPRVLEHDYELCLFDGLSRFYVAAEHPELRAAVSYPACIFDNYVLAREEELRHRVAAAEASSEQMWNDVVSWRTLALDAWSSSFGSLAILEARVARLRGRLRQRNAELRRARAELRNLQASASWRVTGPLRAARSRVGNRVGRRSDGA